MHLRTGRWEYGYSPFAAGISGEREGPPRSRGEGVTGLAPVLIAACLLAAGEAGAFFDDRIDLIVEERITYDSNIFRIPDGVSPPAFAAGRRKDLSATTSVGLTFDIPHSRQRFQGGLALNDTRYRHLSDLDFQGHDGRALWLWQIGRDWSGQLGYSTVETLGSFANDQTKTPNKVQTDEMLFSANYLVTPYWRLGAGVTRREQANSEATRQENDVEVVGTELTVTHISRAKNQLGVRARHEDGSYAILATRTIMGTPTLIDNAYQQNSIGVFLDWTLTGRSRVTAGLDRVKRSYEQLAQRDFEGFIGRAAHDWKPTGRLVVVTTVQRDISAVEEINTSFVRVTGVSVRPTLTLTGRTTLSGALEYAVRDYLGDLGAVTGTAGALPPRTDKVLSAAATLTWQVDRVLALLLAVQHEKRTSNIPINVYDVNLISLNGRLRF